VPRRGYRFVADVTRAAARESDAGLDALLAPHRAFIEGRAALETLEAPQIARARSVFASAVVHAPDHPASHVGLANACILQFEMTRADAAPDVDARAAALHHAREACRLDPQSGEAWSTLGFVLDSGGDVLDARAASRRAVALEPDNWRHYLRLAYATWGEERLRAAGRTLELLPGFPLARWLAATVHVARQALPEAERELAAGIAVDGQLSAEGARFSPVALHWMLGLLRFARGDEGGALDELHAELAGERAGHIYARECAANSWYAIGAIHLWQGRKDDAAAALHRAVERIPCHPLAHVALAALGAGSTTHVPTPTTADVRGRHSIEATMATAAHLVLTGNASAAASLVDEALAGGHATSAGWVLPIDPLLRISACPDAWARVVARLRNRAA
jgi:tetratricopeptide (TPR) repeat protein